MDEFGYKQTSAKIASRMRVFDVKRISKVGMDASRKQMSESERVWVWFNWTAVGNDIVWVLSYSTQKCGKMPLINTNASLANLRQTEKSI